MYPDQVYLVLNLGGGDLSWIEATLAVHRVYESYCSSLQSSWPTPRTALNRNFGHPNGCDLRTLC
jgi:hypothetical protein